MLTSDRVILIFFALMFILGAADYLLGSRMGLGTRFKEGLETFAPLFLTMAGFIVLTPVLTRLLAPAAEPFFRLSGADPGLFPGMVLANDNGGYHLAQKLCFEKEAGGFGGMLLGSILGANLICLPLALQLLDRQDRRFYFTGQMFGIMAIPFGLFAGGLAAGYRIGFILRQMPPIVLIAGIVALLLWRIPEKLVKALFILAKVMEILSISGACAAVFLELSGFSLPGLDSIQVALKIIGSIVIVLPGVYVFTTILSRILSRKMPFLARRLGINDPAVAGFFSTLANSIPTLLVMKQMDSRGKLLNCAFLAPGAFMLGDHLAFCGAVAPELLIPLILTKFTAAVVAVLLAWFYLRCQRG